MELITISGGSVSLLHQFLTNPMPTHFRYFERRTPADALRNHILTVIGVIAGVPVAYGHIDYETNYWVGLCVLPAHQRKGYGAQLLEYLISHARRHPLIDKLHLTVDADNTGARALYERTGFLVEPASTSAAIVRMALTLKPIIHLPVSYGEAVDKLTILDIKLDMIRDARRLDVQKEYDAIYRDISGYLTDTIGYYYSILKDINHSIWVMQDQFRESTNPAEKNELCTKIIVENDRRFRVKSKVNNYFQSSLKEQKGYISRKAFVLTHLGLGDMITANGMVRYLSTNYEKVVVVCKRNNMKNVLSMYLDDPTIEVYPVADDSAISPNYGAPISLMNRIKETHDVYLAGSHVEGGRYRIKDVPFSFYDDVHMNYSIFWQYFHVPTTTASKALLEQLKLRGITDYIIVHNSSSSGEVFSMDATLTTFRIDSDITLVINTSKNIYSPGHPFHEVAQLFVMEPLINYKSVIENASKIIVSDSSLFCLAMNLTPQRLDTEGYLISRASSYSHIYSAKYAPPSTERRIIFQQIRL